MVHLFINRVHLFNIDPDRKRLKLLTKVSFDDIWSADGRSLPEHVCGYVLGVYYEINYRRKEILIEYYYKGEMIKRYYFSIDRKVKIKK